MTQFESFITGSFLYCRYTFRDGYREWRRGWPHEIMQNPENRLRHGFVVKVECPEYPEVNFKRRRKWIHY